MVHHCLGNLNRLGLHSSLLRIWTEGKREKRMNKGNKEWEGRDCLFQYYRSKFGIERITNKNIISVLNQLIQLR